MKVATTTLVWPLSCVSLWMQGAKTCTSGEIVANANTSVKGGKRMRKTRVQKARKQNTRKHK